MVTESKVILSSRRDLPHNGTFRHHDNRDHVTERLMHDGASCCSWRTAVIGRVRPRAPAEETYYEAAGSVPQTSEPRLGSRND
jgi:hypothetical protein